jgi:hypothetical protein
MSSEETIISDVTEKVKEYAELSKTIKIIQEKLKVLNVKKKELYKEVLPKLKTNNVTKCNLAFGTLKLVTSKRKIMPNRTTMKEKYASFFNSVGTEYEFLHSTPQQKSDMLYKYVYIDNIEFKQENSISMTYNKEFKEQLKIK